MCSFDFVLSFFFFFFLYVLFDTSFSHLCYMSAIAVRSREKITEQMSQLSASKSQSVEYIWNRNPQHRIHMEQIYKEVMLIQSLFSPSRIDRVGMGGGDEEVLFRYQSVLRERSLGTAHSSKQNSLKDYIQEGPVFISRGEVGWREDESWPSEQRSPVPTSRLCYQQEQ